MPAYINLAALRTTEMRSDALGPLDSLAHLLAPASYFGALFKNDSQIASFVIEVGTDGSGEQIDIDIAALEREKPDKPFVGGGTGQPGIFAVFHSSGEDSGYHVVLASRGTEVRGYDSRRLEAGDYYIATLVRPGRYQASVGKAKEPATITVTQAKPCDKPRASEGGAMLKVSASSIAPQAAQIVSGDGVVFEIKDDCSHVRLARAAEKSKPSGRRAVGVRVHGRAAREGLAVKRG